VTPGAQEPRSGGQLPGEPGVLSEGRPPFVADHPTIRWLFDLNRRGIRPGLQRVRGLLEDLGHPERDFPVLVVAGTNGKGSTTRIVARLLQSAGLKTACYTSPHLLRVYERLTIDDRPVEPELFRRTADSLRTSVDRHQASWFETLTATSLACARELDVDVFCCEVGLGGRLDASNALPAVATLLTSVSLDHQQVLGDTVEAIAAEKLGLLKPDVPLFTTVGEALRGQVFRAAVEAGSPCHFLDELAEIRDAEAGLWTLATRARLYADLPDLRPAAMRRNAALALLCLETLDARGVLPLPADPAASLREVFLPGRFQLVLTAPDWIVDTAHNAEALDVALSAFLARPCAGRRVVVFGGMADKVPGTEVGALLARCDAVELTPVSLPRSRNSESLLSLTRLWGLDEDRVRVHASVDATLQTLAHELAPADAVLVCGSCFLAGETFQELGVTDLDAIRAPRPAAAVLSHRRGETR
jgi:dihydrofolate synthase/folylpolyglutamate synthase